MTTNRRVIHLVEEFEQGNVYEIPAIDLVYEHHSKSRT